jgi:hypothetical protein
MMIMKEIANSVAFDKVLSSFRVEVYECSVTSYTAGFALENLNTMYWTPYDIWLIFPNTDSVLFIVYVTMPPGIGLIALGNKYIYI